MLKLLSLVNTNKILMLLNYYIAENKKSLRRYSKFEISWWSTVHQESQLCTNDTADVDFTVDIGWIRCQESLVSFCNRYIGHESKLSRLKTSSNQATYIKTWSCSLFPWCLIIAQILVKPLSSSTKQFGKCRMQSYKNEYELFIKPYPSNNIRNKPA